MEQTQIYRILWRERTDKSAALVRMYGISPHIFVPPQIAGRPCTEIAPYCFAEQSRLPDTYLEEVSGGEKNCPAFLGELCGSVIEEVSLPDTVETIGNCAFYNCKKLKALHIGAGTKEIGSDAFMNTLSLQKIILRCAADEKSGIRRILGQISSDLEVVFKNKGKTEAALLYPDYYESYDEIAPAHLFGKNISGEGFRARQCFKDGKVDFAGYDDVFLQACVEEKEETLSKMAVNRLKHPFELNNRKKEIYENYLKEHIQTFVRRLTRKKDLDTLCFLCDEKLLDGKSMTGAVRMAADACWAEGAAELMQRTAAFREAEKKDRYDF